MQGLAVPDQVFSHGFSLRGGACRRRNLQGGMLKDENIQGINALHRPETLSDREGDASPSTEKPCRGESQSPAHALDLGCGIWGIHIDYF